METIREKVAKLAESLKGDWFQSDWAGFEGKLIEVLYNIVDRIPAAQLTVVSKATEFGSGSDLTQEECCEALGLTEEQLNGLFSGSFFRMAYGVNESSALSVVFVSPHLVILGAADTAEIQIAKINDLYTIQVTYV